LGIRTSDYISGGRVDNTGCYCSDDGYEYLGIFERWSLACRFQVSGMRVVYESLSFRRRFGNTL
jgi:hypothetical protein